jgi:Trypsin-co-occurring domain 1
MAKIVAMQSSSGTPLLVEASVEPTAVADGVVETGFADRVRDGAAAVSASLEATVRAAAEALATAAFAIEPAPAEVEVTFGVTAAGEAGNVVIGRGTAGANFTVRCLWRRDPSSSAD